MTGNYKKVFVVAPGATVSGGPEVLHQLVHELRSVGVDASISYMPADRVFEKPVAYAAYDAPQSAIEDCPGNLVVVPETLFELTRKIRAAQCAVWWLSVDYYLPRLHDGVWRDYWRMLKCRLLGRRPWRLSSLRGMLHFTQSEYARAFLARSGVAAHMLSDYLGGDHFAHQVAHRRRDRILFNPRKGFKTTERLIAANPDLEFLPLQGMSPAVVAQALRESKLYIDFGFHPGKDRMPREAALAGCCVIVGKRGSAAYAGDVNIPDRYKLDEDADGFLPTFRSTALSIFNAFDEHDRDFDAYRCDIRAEHEIFRRQVREIFGSS